MTEKSKAKAIPASTCKWDMASKFQKAAISTGAMAGILGGIGVALSMVFQSQATMAPSMAIAATGMLLAGFIVTNLPEPPSWQEKRIADQGHQPRKPK